MKQALLVLLIVAAVIGIAIVYSKLSTKWELKKWNAEFPFLFDLRPTHYDITRITNSNLQIQQDIIKVAQGDSTVQQLDFQSHIYFDTVNHNWWIQAEELRPDSLTSYDGYYLVWLHFDNNGNVQQRIEQDSIVNEEKKRWVKLKALDLYSYNWQDSSAALYMNHFIKEEYNWNALNPFRDIGNPTGGRPVANWLGTSYLSLKMKRETLPFKTPNQLDNFGYMFRIAIYAVPPEYSDGKEICFVYIDNQFWNKPDRGLYMIAGKE